MNFNITRSECNKSIATNATLIALSIASLVSNCLCVIEVQLIMVSTLVMSITLLIYSAIKLSRAITIKQHIVFKGELTRAVLLWESGKSIGASAFMMTSSVAIAATCFALNAWGDGFVCLAIFIYTAIELSVAVSLRNEYFKGNRGDEKTQQTINGCAEKMLGGGAAMLAIAIMAMAYMGYHLAEVKLWYPSSFESVFICDLTGIFLYVGIFVYLAVKVAMADKAKKNYLLQEKLQAERPAIMEEINVVTVEATESEEETPEAQAE